MISRIQTTPLNFKGTVHYDKIKTARQLSYLYSLAPTKQIANQQLESAIDAINSFKERVEKNTPDCFEYTLTNAVQMPCYEGEVKRYAAVVSNSWDDEFSATVQIFNDRLNGSGYGQENGEMVDFWKDMYLPLANKVIACKYADDAIHVKCTSLAPYTYYENHYKPQSEELSDREIHILSRLA